jgi:hypothetical protein
MLEETKRWESTDAFVATCNAFTALDEAKKQLGHKHRLDPSIEDVNTLQDLLISRGYSIQKIKSQI